MRLPVRILTLLLFLIATLLPASAAVAGAAEVTRSGQIGGLFTTCTNEVVELEGTYLNISRQLPDGKYDQRVIIHATGTGASGAEYVWNYESHWVTNGIQFSFEDDRAVLISLGSADNLRTVFHFQNEPFEYSFTPYCTG